MFLKNLLAFDSVNSTISKNAVSKCLRHLWHLSEALVSLAFFDDTLPVSVKKSMVESVFKSAKNKGKRLKRAEITSKDLQDVKNMDLSFFVTPNSLNFFKILNISYTFLNQSPNELPKLNDFQKALKIIVKHLKVVNDNAERGVALIQTFNNTLTKNEEQKQFLLKIVMEHRQAFPTPAKKFL